MATIQSIHATFFVHSGCICYGALHNIYHGSGVPIQGFSSIRPHVSGTVNMHKLEFNITAQNGTWNVYQLINVKRNQLTGYFIAHSDVDPDQEIDKILRVSGSPYEFDSGSHMNDELTEAEGVCVINRYDWGYYEGRDSDEIGEGIDEGEHDMLANSNSAGLVDYSHARIQVDEWKEQRPSERTSSEKGFWLYVPHAEYMFGRFGFDDARTAARSFLFFNIGTDFTETAFAGSQQTLRQYETHEERFQRRLRDGYDFSGLKLLYELSPKEPNPNHDPRFMLPEYPSQPPETELVGPHDPQYYIFGAEEFTALAVMIQGIGSPLAKRLRQQGVEDLEAYERSRKTARFVKPWENRVYRLLNEVTLTYLERWIVPLVSQTDISTIADSLFHDRGKGTQLVLDDTLYPKFTNPKPIPDFDSTVVGERIRKFLESRSGTGSVAFDDKVMEGVVYTTAFMLSEVIDLSGRCSIDSYRSAIVPADVRLIILRERDHFAKLGFSRIYWKGGE